MPKRTFDPTERIGVNAVERIVTSELEWIWREQPVADFGVDGQIEALDDQGKPSGQLFAVQVKSGSSYFHGTGETIPFYVDEDHLKYWDQHALPVILVLHNPDDKNTIWQWADLKSARNTGTRWCIDIPRTKIFNAAIKGELKDQVWTDDTIGLRRRYAFDREFMKKFKDIDGFVTIDKWLNKHLQYREIKFRFGDPDKEIPDYEMPIMATWHYEVSDLMRHFLPWLDYEYVEDPDDSCAEVQGHEMAVWLSKPAKLFLELEEYFDNPPQPPELDESEPDIYDDDWRDAQSQDES